MSGSGSSASVPGRAYRHAIFARVLAALSRAISNPRARAPSLVSELETLRCVLSVSPPPAALVVVADFTAVVSISAAAAATAAAAASPGLVAPSEAPSTNVLLVEAADPRLLSPPAVPLSLSLPLSAVARAQLVVVLGMVHVSVHRKLTARTAAHTLPRVSTDGAGIPTTTAQRRICGMGGGEGGDLSVNGEAYVGAGVKKGEKGGQYCWSDSNTREQSTGKMDGKSTRT